MKHTPGPWTIEDINVLSIRAKGFCGAICDVHWPLSLPASHPEAEAVRHANANLIAAAPDLLAACKAALPASKGEVRWAIMAAIAKAKGETPCSI